jgi:hypothetical protein
MYSAPDFIKISVQQANAFASGSQECEPEWEMNNWSQNPDCQKVIIEGMGYSCYMGLNMPS